MSCQLAGLRRLSLITILLHGALLLCYSDEVRSQLAPHLPEGTEPTTEAMAELLRSPQFAQTTQNLTQV